MRGDLEWVASGLPPCSWPSVEKTRTGRHRRRMVGSTYAQDSGGPSVSGHHGAPWMGRARVHEYMV